MPRRPRSSRRRSRTPSALLRAAGFEVEFPRRQVCCGQPAFNAGHRKAARRVARTFVRAFSRARADRRPRRAPARRWSSHYLPELARRRAATTSGSSRPSSTRRASSCRRGTRAARSPITTPATCCASSDLEGRRGGCSSAPAPRSCCSPRPDLCCGFGGTFSVRQPEVSLAMADDKLGGARGVGAEALVTADPGCLMHLRGRAERAGRRSPVVHLATALARGVAAAMTRARRPAAAALPRASRAREARATRTRSTALDSVDRALYALRRIGSMPGASSARSRSCASGRTRSACGPSRRRPPPRGVHRRRSRPAAATSRCARRPRRPARTSSSVCRAARREARRQVEVDGDRGDPAQRGARGGRHPSRSRPTSASTSSSWPASTRCTSSPRRSRRRRRTSPSSSRGSRAVTVPPSSRRSPRSARRQLATGLPRGRRRHHRRELRASPRRARSCTGHERGQRAASSRRCRSVHIAITGIERLVPTLADLAPLLAAARPQRHRASG